MEPGAILRDARHAAGLTQAELARRAGTTQAAIARVEGGRVSPTVRTLQRLLARTGRTLELKASPTPSGIDESLIRGRLRMTPAERLRAFEQTHADARALAAAGERARAGRR